MVQEKKKALLILGMAGVISTIVSLFLGIIIVTFFPLLITFLLILLGMLGKWVFEWCIKNIHIFKIKENASKIKKKLKVEEGIDIVKDSYKVFKK